MARGDCVKHYEWSPWDHLKRCEWSGGTIYSALDGLGGPTKGWGGGDELKYDSPHRSHF